MLRCINVIKKEIFGNRYVFKCAETPREGGNAEISPMRSELTCLKEEIMLENAAIEFAKKTLTERQFKGSQSVDQYARQTVESIKQSGMELTGNNIRFIISLAERGSEFGTINRNGRFFLDQVQQKHRKTISALRAVLFLNPTLSETVSRYEEELKNCNNEKEVYELVQKLSHDEDLAGQIPDSVMSILEKMCGARCGSGESAEQILQSLQNRPLRIGKYQVNVDRVVENAKKDIGSILRNPLWSSLIKGGSIDRDLLVRSLFDHEDSDPSLLPQKTAEAFVIKYYILPVMQTNDFDREYALADFEAGQFTCRNTAIQSALNEELGISLVLDGDLSFYDRNGQPRVDKDSATMTALRRFGVEGVEDFVKCGKKAGIENTQIWQELIVEKSRPTRVVPSFIH
ncbi:MAG: DUF1615 family protein [Candidatus Gracilibacteria bacterium]|jgi:hypothetical protein